MVPMVTKPAMVQPAAYSSSRMTGRPHDLCRIGGMLLCHYSLARYFPRHDVSRIGHH